VESKDPGVHPLFVKRQGILSGTSMNDTAAYLNRIGYGGPTAPTAETLHAIHRAHMLAVPFENLDIGLGRKIECNENAAVRKIVELRRGGFCYEMNGAFAALLRALGFSVTLLSARVARQDGSEGPEFDHLTLRVDMGEPWLADVGFGDSFLEPLRLELELEQPQGRRAFRIVEIGDRLQMEMQDAAKTWKRQYSFTLQPRQLQDFAGMCHYHQTSPQSHFTQNRVCTLATPEGRVTLADFRLIITRDGQREETMVKSDREREEVLKKYFGVVL
jgi:N-hydroxyarylamine O-acetyltransferase